jgi:glycosyltransferase involved in cell wall biosynthesis
VRLFFEKCPALKGQSFILFLSRIHEKKGLDLLIQAYEVLLNKKMGNGQLDKGPASMPKLVIAGPGIETDYGKKMLQMVEESGMLKQSVVFPGMLSGKAKWGAFYACEAFVLPSHQENFGIAVVEALACGKPVLISNQVNIWREIMEGEAGIVEDDTLAGTGQLLDKWIQLSPEEKGMMGRHAQNVFIQNFTIRNAAKKFSQYLGERESA